MKRFLILVAILSSMTLFVSCDYSDVSDMEVLYQDQLAKPRA